MSSSPIRTDIRGLIDIALPISIGTFVQFLVLLTDNYFLAGGTKRAFAVEMLGAGSYFLCAWYLTSPIDGGFRPIKEIWRVEWVYFTFIFIGCMITLWNGRWKKGLESLS